MKAAQGAFEGWRDATPADRQKALLKLADGNESRAEELVKTESDNTGKPLALTALGYTSQFVDRFTADEGGVPGHVLPGGLALQHPRRPGEASWATSSSCWL